MFSSRTTFRTSAGSTGEPAFAVDMHLGAAMLRLGDVAGFAERLGDLRVGDAHAEEISRRQPRRPRQPDEQRVDVGAFAAEIARFQQERDIADPAAARRRVAIRIVDDPVIDRPRLVEGRVRLPTISRAFAEHDPVGRRARRRLQIFGQLLRAGVGRIPGAVAGLDAGGDRDLARRCRLQPRGRDDRRPRRRLPQHKGRDRATARSDRPRAGSRARPAAPAATAAPAFSGP